MVAPWDAAGVDGALVVSTFLMYGYDPSYALSVHAAYPGRIRVITPVDPTDIDITDKIADWAATSGAVGIRMLLMGGASPTRGPRYKPRSRRRRATRPPGHIQCWGAWTNWRSWRLEIPTLPL